MFIEKLAKQLCKVAAYDWRDVEDQKVHEQLMSDPSIDMHNPEVRNSFRNWRNFQAGLAAAGTLGGIGLGLKTGRYVPAVAGAGLIGLPAGLYAYGNNKNMNRYDKYPMFRRNANLEHAMDEMGLGSRAIDREANERADDRLNNALSAWMIASALESNN